ncbi:MAG: histidinol dehydrogenase [Oligoflexales bacterium]|nr:histidinol dehydrogenase [Oligoflexales bacterium]
MNADLFQKYVWDDLEGTRRAEILKRPDFYVMPNITENINEIIEDVKTRDDRSLINLTHQYDGVALHELEVTKSEFESCERLINSETKKAFEKFVDQTENFYLNHRPDSIEYDISTGIKYYRNFHPIEKVGFYIPGGPEPIASTVIMLAVPARIAGCSLRIMCSPPSNEKHVDPHILFAAKISGVHQVFKIGGAQAMAAMAYGTQSVPKVDKILGRGGPWVTEASRIISQDLYGVSCEMPVSFSELLIIADDKADSRLISVDLLAEAEQGINTHSLLVTDSPRLAMEVEKIMIEDIKTLPRKLFARESLKNVTVVIARDLEQAVEISNLYAPAHLSIQVEKPRSLMKNIKNAGTVFLGELASKSIGDYMGGANHLLPTYGFSRVSNGISLNSFLKAVSFQEISGEGVGNIGQLAELMSKLEGGDAHREAIRKRIEKARLSTGQGCGFFVYKKGSPERKLI